MHRYLYLGTGVSSRFDGEGVALRKQLCVSGKPFKITATGSLIPL